MSERKFTTANYLDAIDREIKKRETAYPKMILKSDKNGLPDAETQELIDALGIQLSRLEFAGQIIMEPDRGYLNKEVSTEILAELTREYKMRKKCYPRWVALRRMDATTAECELAVWKEMCFWFADKFLGLDHLPPLSKRGHPIYP